MRNEDFIPKNFLSAGSSHLYVTRTKKNAEAYTPRRVLCCSCMSPRRKSQNFPSAGSFEMLVPILAIEAGQ